jgi:hypothetical protein
LLSAPVVLPIAPPKPTPKPSSTIPFERASTAAGAETAPVTVQAAANPTDVMEVPAGVQEPADRGPRAPGAAVISRTDTEEEGTGLVAPKRAAGIRGRKKPAPVPVRSEPIVQVFGSRGPAASRLAIWEAISAAEPDLGKYGLPEGEAWVGGIVRQLPGEEDAPMMAMSER